MYVCVYVCGVCMCGCVCKIGGIYIVRSAYIHSMQLIYLCSRLQGWPQVSSQPKQAGSSLEPRPSCKVFFTAIFFFHGYEKTAWKAWVRR